MGGNTVKRLGMTWSWAGLVAVAVATVALGWTDKASAQPAAQAPVEGAVFTLTNSAARNEVIAWRRGVDGTLSMPRHYDTGGKGSGTFENVDTMIVLGSAAGQSSPVDLGGGSDLLFAANAGSDQISVFQVSPNGNLTLVEIAPSGGERPISLTVKNGLLYVLNSAGDLTGAGFCLGGAPTISGFRVSMAGRLTPIPDSTRSLSGGSNSGCAQISFNPAGTALIVTQLAADTIDTFTVDANGVASGPTVNQTTGTGPFGFTFDRGGRMLLSENFQAREGQGALTTYTVGANGTIMPAGQPLRIGETDPCWVVVTPDGRYAYVTSFGPVPIVKVRAETSRRGAVSSFRLSEDGSVTLVNAQAALTDVGAADIALSRDGRYLYALNSVTGTVSGWRVGDDGSLTLVTSVGGVPVNPFGPLASGMAAR